MTSVYIATEDALSEAIVERLITETEGELSVGVPIRGNGFGKLKGKLPSLIRLAPNVPVVMRESPEALADPKQTLLNLVRRHSPASLQRDLVTDHGSGPKPGLSYNPRLVQFVKEKWSPTAASEQSTSLARARQRILELAERVRAT